MLLIFIFTAYCITTTTGTATMMGKIILMGNNYNSDSINFSM